MKPSGFRSYEVRGASMSRHAGAPYASPIFATREVQAWVSELSSKRGASVVQTAYSVLARILDDAVRDRLLASNPARGVKLPKRAPRRNVYLTAAQLDQLAVESGRYLSLVLLLGVGGLRWGEAAALTGVQRGFSAAPCRVAPQRRHGEQHDHRRHAEVEPQPHPWCCPRSSSTCSPRQPRAKVATTYCGRRMRAATSVRRRQPCRGCLAPSLGARRPILSSPGLRRMLCAIRLPRWQSAQVPT